ncbi:NADPH:quinone reductase [Flavobacterium akiainvivens]|nr:NADPH:quinone reductase [Flavobacterium akiainvivens]
MNNNAGDKDKKEQDDTMKAWILEGVDGIKTLKLRTREIPQIGNGQVLVSMKAWSLNYRDMLLVSGRHSGVNTGIIPLSDGAGEVVAIGKDVSRFNVGDRVAGIYSQHWINGGAKPDYPGSALGGPIDGVLAEYIVFSEEGLVRLPHNLSYEEGATLPCAAVTAWNGLIVSCAPTVGQTVLTMGSGGVSLFALQLAKAAGATVIATSGSDQKLDRLKELGADMVINYNSTPGWDEEVLRLTNGAGVDHIIEVGGTGTLDRSLNAIKTGGHIALIGILAAGNAVDFGKLIMKNINLRGIGNVGSREMFESLNTALEMRNIRPVIDKVFPFHEVDAAFRYFESRANFGKVVISL